MDFKSQDDTKKKKSPTVMPATPETSGPPVCVEVTTDQGRELKVGDEVTLTVKGEVSAIRKPYGESAERSKLTVEISKPREIQVESNAADQAVKKMIQNK